MISAALLLMLKSSETPDKILKEVSERYRKCSSLQATVVRENWPGAFAGSSTHSLKWSKGRFEMIIRERQPGSQVPSWYCDGRKAVALYPDGRRIDEPSKPKAGFATTFEAVGGVMLSFLQDTTSAKALFAPPKNSKVPDKYKNNPNYVNIDSGAISFEFGERSSFDGESAQEIMLSRESEGKKTLFMSFFVSPEKKTLLGCSAPRPEGEGFLYYRSQIFDAPLPAGLGNLPGRDR